MAALRTSRRTRERRVASLPWVSACALSYRVPLAFSFHSPFLILSPPPILFRIWRSWASCALLGPSGLRGRSSGLRAGGGCSPSQAQSSGLLAPRRAVLPPPRPSSGCCQPSRPRLGSSSPLLGAWHFAPCDFAVPVLALALSPLSRRSLSLSPPPSRSLPLPLSPRSRRSFRLPTHPFLPLSVSIACLFFLEPSDPAEQPRRKIPETIAKSLQWNLRSSSISAPFSSGARGSSSGKMTATPFAPPTDPGNQKVKLLKVPLTKPPPLTPRGCSSNSCFEVLKRIQNVRRCYIPPWEGRKRGSAGSNHPLTPCAQGRLAGSSSLQPEEKVPTGSGGTQPSRGPCLRHPAPCSGHLQDPGTLHQRSWWGSGHRRLLFQENTIIFQRL
ncbi:uncharacterized protein LOC110344936 [Heterocephalus glaber]|uniref:Uncharacterized protein LOC110344936 n=1 Tax=Heterocephalus glaber TaxID=10181 RepID=A0AAX6RFZ3_HETGA|nr:uncharacterized protein LOC110344936 [Heterocephalus glaber]